MNDKIKKDPVDWEMVELHYRSGIRSLKDIGYEYGVSDAGIIKRARRDKWTRDLSAKIKAKAEAKVSAAAVSAEVSERRNANEIDIVEANASKVAEISLSHRADLAKLRDRARSYEEELDQCGDDLSKRVSILKALSDTQKTLITLERDVFGISTSSTPGQTLDAFLRSALSEPPG